ASVFSNFSLARPAAASHGSGSVQPLSMPSDASSTYSCTASITPRPKPSVALSPSVRSAATELMHVLTV
ncbi:unnamed protein product, partial [Urochloa humidicola]